MHPVVIPTTPRSCPYGALSGPLYGNLPTKSFYSDGAMPVEEVMRRTEELIANMRACGHPHIVGSECDVLFVPGAADAIRAKVEAMMQVAAPA